MGWLRAVRLIPWDGPRIICPETQGKLEDLRPHDGPVRLYVWHVIEQEPGCCECLEVINRSRFLFATSVGGWRGLPSTPEQSATKAESVNAVVGPVLCNSTKCKW